MTHYKLIKAQRSKVEDSLIGHIGECAAILDSMYRDPSRINTADLDTILKAVSHIRIAAIDVGAGDNKSAEEALSSIEPW